jgi:hypothetical protein
VGGQGQCISEPLSLAGVRGKENSFNFLSFVYVLRNVTAVIFCLSECFVSGIQTRTDLNEVLYMIHDLMLQFKNLNPEFFSSRSIDLIKFSHVLAVHVSALIVDKWVLAVHVSARIVHK